MMKKCTLSLLIAFVLCLGLSGCGRTVKQSEATAVNDTDSSESSSAQSTGSSSDQNADSSLEQNADSSLDQNEGENTDSSSHNGSDSSSHSGSGSSSGKNTNNQIGEIADNQINQIAGNQISQDNQINQIADNKSDQNTAQNTDSSSHKSSGGSSHKSSGSSSGSDSGSSSGGGSTTPPVQGNKLIKSVADTSDVTVEYGTDKAAAAAKLPGTVVLNCTDGSTIRGSVASWVVDTSYNAKPDKQTAYTATGKVTLPAGSKSFYGTTLKATVRIIVRGGDTVIKSIKEPGEIEVAYGTSEAAAKKQLPSEVALTCVSDNVTFGTVTWNRKSGTAYVAKPAGAAAVIPYTGTVKLPGGYRLDSSVATTIETTIRVLKDGDTLTPKYVTSKPATLEIPIPYTTNTAEIEENLPEKVRLYCNDDSVITVTAEKTKWVAHGSDSGSGDYAKTYKYKYCYADITLPDSYTFDPAINKDTTYAAADICVKKRDNTKLKAAFKDASNLHENRIAMKEEWAGGENDKIYVAPEGTKPADVTAGIKFIVNSGENKAAIDTVYTIKYNEFGVIWDWNDYKPDASQAFVDKRAEEINAATAALRKVLDNNYQIGTCFKPVNIVNNVKALLESESFKKGGNYVYDPANYPMILGKDYMLPQYVTVVVDAKGTKAEVELEWEVHIGGGENVGGDFTTVDANGNKLRNAVVTPTSTYENQPRNLTCLVYVVRYQNGSGWVNLGHEQVEAYNSCITGALLYQDASVSFDKSELTSGKENTFTAKAAFPYYEYYKYVERIEPDQITVENADGYTASDGKPLLSDIKVTSVNTDQDEAKFFPEFTMTATAAPLAAVVDETSSAVDGKVKLSIPADAITLTEYAKEQGWYLPEDGLELKAEVAVYKPALTVNSVEKASGKDDVVKVEFSTAHWSGSDVRVALLENAKVSFDDNADKSSLSKSDSASVDSDGSYAAEIDTSELKRGETYKVWVKVGDEDWKASKKTYTLSASYSTTAMPAEFAVFQDGEALEDILEPEAEEDKPKTTDEDEQTDAASDADADAASDADSDKQTDAASDKQTGADSGKQTDADSGKQTDAASNTYSETAAGRESDSSKDRNASKDDLDSEKEEDDSETKDESTQDGTHSENEGAADSGE